jgi:hypothetical protein
MSELINDERLTPDMEVTRSGSTMLFRKNYGDREFTSRENADVVIEAPRKELFAKLTDGKWYWKNGCPECKGEEPQWAYVKCEEHDRCVDCRKKRSEIEGNVWGHRKGFQCKPCKELEDKITRRKALEKVAEKEYDPWDYQNEDKILCPHCGSEIYHDDGDGDPSGEMDCDVCNGKFKIETEYTVTYSTSIIGERITLNKENEEWEKKYVDRLIEKGFDPDFARKTMEAGKDDFDYLEDPADCADEEISRWSE